MSRTKVSGLEGKIEVVQLRIFKAKEGRETLLLYNICVASLSLASIWKNDSPFLKRPGDQNRQKRDTQSHAQELRDLNVSRPLKRLLRLI